MKLLLMPLIISGSLYGMETTLIERSTHNARVAALQEEIAEIGRAITIEDQRQVKVLTSTHRRLEARKAITPLIYAAFVGGKTAYDIYTLLYTPEVAGWYNITSLTLDGALVTLCLGKSAWSLARACCSSPFAVLRQAQDERES